MSKYLVVRLPEQEKAYEATRALNELHDEGSITLYAHAALARDAEGRLAIKSDRDEGPIGFAFGGLTGGLLGLIGGPVGAALGMGMGSVVGAFADIHDAGVGDEFLAEVASHAGDAPALVVAEIDEDWQLPVDTRMEALGGTVVRRPRIDVEDAQIDREIEAWNAEMDQLDAEIEKSSDEAKARLEAKKKDLQAKVESAATRAKERIRQIESEAEARVQSLKDQWAKQTGEAKAAIENRIEAVKSDYARRQQLLGDAGQKLKQALA